MPGKLRTTVVKGPQFPVEVSTGTIVYQVKDGRGWKSVCEVSADVAAKTIAVLSGWKRKQGTDYRFVTVR